MLFFDGALLALGNVRTRFSPPACLTQLNPLSRADSLSWRPLPYHRPAKDVLLFFPQEQAARHRLLPRRYSPRLSQVANDRRVGRDVRFSKSFRVRDNVDGITIHTSILTCSPFRFRDFFPVILTFLRQLPFVGQLLNLPYIRPVRHPPSLFHSVISRSLARRRRASANGSFSSLTYLRSMKDTTPIFYYLALSDSTPATLVVNPRCHWILDMDAGSDCNTRRASLLTLSPNT